MPIKVAVKQPIVEADYFEIVAFSIDISNRTIQIVYNLGSGILPDGSAKIIRRGELVTIRDNTLLAPLWLKHYNTLKYDLYKLCQDVKVFPAGPVT